MRLVAKKHGLCALILMLTGNSGCGSQPFAATTNKYIPGEPDTQPHRVLNASEQIQVASSFHATATGQVAHRTIGPAAGGIRWSDLDLALSYACDDVEMAVVHTTLHEWGVECQLRTIDDYPATLTVERIDDGSTYNATAVVGRFGDRFDQAEALLAALDRQWHAFGSKRSIRRE